MKRTLVAGLTVALTACETVSPPGLASANMASVELTSPADGPARVVLRAPRPATALHFATALGTYRSSDWRIVDRGFRWVIEGDGERLERSDGAPFTTVSFTVEQRYRSLIKSYAPFAPFSDGGLLVYTGHFHACLTLPCSGEGAVRMTIAAPGRTIRAGEAVGRVRLRYVSRGEGTNVYIGKHIAQIENGMAAIIDPGLPERLRAGLARAVPAAMAHFTRSYGELSFQPQLFASIDTRGRADGKESTQGGTLPGQIFIHFDGARARERAEQGDPGWLEWFFAHEVAHMFQRDRTSDKLGDNAYAWMHEGGADAMAASVLAAQGKGVYVATRIRNAARTCDKGLGKGPLTTAAARDDFELHYSCGMIAVATVDRALRPNGGGIEAFNRRFFAAVAAQAKIDPETWFTAARDSGVAEETLALLRALVGDDPARAKAALRRLAPQLGAEL